eukprot:maker-scaffold_2-snap-gene-14.39-mRNA-1 protein AED:0.00 eAED:0.00 QI:281/1/1/1/1/1/4/621/455
MEESKQETINVETAEHADSASESNEDAGDRIFPPLDNIDLVHEEIETLEKQQEDNKTENLHAEAEETLEMLKSIKIISFETDNSFRPITHYIFSGASLDDTDLQVRRRYSEFVTLCAKLGKAFPGMVLPALPPKILLPNPSKTALRARLYGLNLFLKKLLANPYLAHHPSIREFLTSTNKPFEDEKKQDDLTARRADPSVLRWLSAVSKVELPADATARLQNLQRQIGTLETKLKTLYSASENLGSASQSYAAAVQDFRSKTTSLLPMEFILNKTAENGTTEEQTSGVSNTAGSFIKQVEELAKIGLKIEEDGVGNADLVSLKLQEEIRFELGLIHELKRVLKQRAALIKMHDDFNQRRLRHEREKFGFERSKQLEQVQKLERKIQKDAEMVKNTYEHGLFITKGLFFSGIENFAKNKALRLAKLRKAFCSEYSAHHKKMSELWALELVESIERL